MAITPILLATFAMLSVLVMSHSAVQVRKHRKTKQSLEVVLTNYAPVDQEALATSDRDWFMPGAVLGRAAERIVTEPGISRLRHLLDIAGHPEQLAVTLRNKALFALALGAVATGFAILLGGWSWALVPVAGVAGFWLPDVLLWNSGLHRTEQLARDLPDAIELLNLCVESGMGFPAALAHVSTTMTGPVPEEFARVLREMRLGRSREEAFESLRQRTTQPDLLRLVHAVVQADQLGISISGVLAEQAAELRSQRRDRAREAAQKVPVKILLPVIACFLPGIFIIVLGPAMFAIGRLFTNLT